MLLLDLPDELVSWAAQNLDIADDLVRLSITCKRLESLVRNSRFLWLTITFSKAGANRITDAQLAALLQRVHAVTCTTHLRLQYSKISGVGLLPLHGSTALQTLDLRQTHGPCAHYPVHHREHLDGEALLKLLKSLKDSTHDKHVFLPTVMQPDSVGHWWVDLIGGVGGDEALSKSIRVAMFDLKQSSLPCSDCKLSKEDSSTFNVACEDLSTWIACSICRGAHYRCDSCCETFICTGCSLTLCGTCVDTLDPNQKACANESCANWLCDVCAEHSLQTCAECNEEFCDACGEDGDEMPGSRFHCVACMEASEDDYFDDYEEEGEGSEEH